VEGISGDGTVIVGYGNDTAAFNQRRALRWTAETGMVILGIMGNCPELHADAVSLDGRVIVGASDAGADEGRPACCSRLIQSGTPAPLYRCAHRRPISLQLFLASTLSE
jgi:uncharacterized membrane protein